MRGIVLMDCWRETARGDVLTLPSQFARSLRGLRKDRFCTQTLLVATVTLGLVACSTGVQTAVETQNRIPPSSTATDRPVTPSATVSDTPRPTRTLTPTPVCTETMGIVESGSYQGFVLPEQIPYNIYLPPCYGWGERKYPVLYLLHGYPFDEKHWIELGVVELVDEKVGSDVWPPFLIVMPRLPEPLFTSSDGGPGSYEQEFLVGLMPHIDRDYQALPISEGRAIAGISRGGIWALEIAFRRPDLIDAVAALSPALHVNFARPPYDPFSLVDDGGQLPGRIFLSAGDQEAPFLVQVEKLSEALDERGVPHTFIIGSGGHDAEAWMGVMEQALNFLVMGWDGNVASDR